MIEVTLRAHNREPELGEGEGAEVFVAGSHKNRIVRVEGSAAGEREKAMDVEVVEA